MEIRFETAWVNGSFASEDECRDCPPPHLKPILELELELEKAYISDRDTYTFQHPLGLYKQACGNGYSVVCNPTGTAHIAVLDNDAADLLERFCSPTSLTTLYTKSAIPEQAYTAVSLFYKLGFLQHPAQASVAPSQEQPETLSAWLHVTNACNLHCAYCYVDKNHEHMTEDVSKQAIDAIFRSAVKHGFDKVWLRYAGGEASLQSERIIALHDYALTLAQQHTIELRASILSNGVFLSPRMIDRLKVRQIGVMISLDGVGSHHDQQRPLANGRGSFQFVDRTITQLLAKKLLPHLSVTISQRNLAGLLELIAYILERDIPFSLNYYRDNDCSTHLRDLQFTEEQMISAMRSVFTFIEHNLPQRSLLGSLIDKADLRHPHQSTCGVGRNYLVVDQRGGIAKCHVEIKRTVATIATHDPLLAIRNDLQGVQGYSVDEKEGCRSCSWRYWCTGGCPLLTYRMTGRSDVKSPNCNIYKALFPDVLRLEALRLLQYVSPSPLFHTQLAEDRPHSSLFSV